MNLWDILDEDSEKTMNQLLRNYNLKKFKPNEWKNRKTNPQGNKEFGKKRRWKPQQRGQKLS